MSVARQEKRLMTAEELWEMPEVPGKRFELVEGELVEVPGTGALHNLLVFAVAVILREHVRKHNLGVVCVDGASYVLVHPGTVRIPDVSFVSRERIPEGGVPEGYWPFAPDLAVEIVSPNDRADEVKEKVREYLAAGTRLVWVLWPRHRSATVHRPDGTARELGPDDELDGGDVLPGFSARVGDLFEA